MNITNDKLDALLDYAVRIRRDLHENPEVGFILPRTSGVVKEELIKIGLCPTDGYGEYSIAVDIGEGNEMIAFRADMDALPITELTGLPYASKRDGVMHACGHDSHTAVLLAVAKYLKENEDKLTRRVRLIFQPAEESATSGAEMMVNRGVMDGISEIIAAHCENSLNVGYIGTATGDYMAACIPLKIIFRGKTAHATRPDAGIDAIAMANEAYGRMKEAAERESRGAKYIWSVGRFVGGEAHNVIADRCEMDISFRYYDNAFAERMRIATINILRDIERKYGGSCELDWHVSTGPVHNDKNVALKLSLAVSEADVKEVALPPRMSSEDFGWYLTKAPGMLFRFGTRNEEKGCTTVPHTADFKIDEDGMRYAIMTFIEYAFRGKEK